jgi:hypothetical protein
MPVKLARTSAAAVRRFNMAQGIFLGSADFETN